MIFDTKKFTGRAKLVAQVGQAAVLVEVYRGQFFWNVQIILIFLIFKFHTVSLKFPSQRFNRLGSKQKYH